MFVQGFRRGIAITASLLVAAGCASTSLRDQWTDPSWRGGPFTRYYVLGIGNDLTNRRIFEDAMVVRLTAAGVQAVPSYRDLPDGAKATEGQIDAAVVKSGADALLMTRLKGVQRETQVSTVMVPGPGPMFGPGWYGMYSAWYPVQEVRQYDVATVETSVFATGTKTLVWTGVTETFNPRSVQQEAGGFADVIVKALAARGLVPAGR
jgi:hypothetical protein